MSRRPKGKPPSASCFAISLPSASDKTFRFNWLGDLGGPSPLLKHCTAIKLKTCGFHRKFEFKIACKFRPKLGLQSLHVVDCFRCAAKAHAYAPKSTSRITKFWSGFRGALGWIAGKLSVPNPPGLMKSCVERRASPRLNVWNKPCR